MEEFYSYEKMPKSFKKMGYSEADFSKLEKLDWCVTEKVHGANFSFIYENNRLSFAKRKSLLKWEDDFFGFQLVVNKLEERILAFFEELSAFFPNQKLILYGELFGGEYPHEEVKKDENLQAIQTGVFYSPTIEFCAFDLRIVGEEDGYLSFKKLEGFLSKYSISYAKPLFVGKMSEAMLFETEINSTIPALLGLPPLNKNLIEGVVLKPYDLELDNIISPRPIIKIKNAFFDEEKKFHEARKWSYIPNLSLKSEELSFLVEDLSLLINKNRVESAVSKIGGISHSDEKRLNELKEEILNDSLLDFNEANDNILNELEEDQLSWVNNRLKSIISKELDLMK